MDRLHRFLFEALDIRGALVQLGPSWRALHGGRGYPGGIIARLGEFAAVTSLIAGNLKSEQRLSCQLQGHGDISLLLMDCQPVQDGPLHLRGMARGTWQASAATLPEHDFSSDTPLPQLAGDGRLVMTLHGQSGQSYQSLVPLTGNSVAAAFEHYLAQSEQQPTGLWLAADDMRACGLFLQRLPGAAERDADGWNRVHQLASTVHRDELALPVEALLHRLFGEEDVRLFAPRAIEWHCPRDERKVLDMLRSLGRHEVEQMLVETGRIEIDDEICGQSYTYGRDILDRLFAPPGRTLH